MTTPPAEALLPQWRCFHCDETFTDKKLAAEHFGTSEADEPGCKMLSAGELELLRDYRRMAAQMERCRSEDCDASRLYHSMTAKLATTERDAEQKGYDRGLADGRAERAAQPKPEVAPDDEAFDALLLQYDLALATSQIEHAKEAREALRRHIAELRSDNAQLQYALEQSEMRYSEKESALAACKTILEGYANSCKGQQRMSGALEFSGPNYSALRRAWEAHMRHEGWNVQTKEPTNG